MAYSVATVQNITNLEPDGRLKVDISYTGTGGETPIVVPVWVNQTASGSNDLRAQAINQLSILNNNKTAPATFGGILPGTILDTATALPLPASAPVQASYAAASLPFSPGTTPQDVFVITGSASKTVTVLRAALTSTQTTAGINNWFLVKRSTANTAGTSTSVAAVPTNSTFVAASATVRQYTANPTAGALVGQVWSGRIDSPSVALAGIGGIEALVMFVGGPGLASFTPIILNGTSQVLAWNFNGAALPAGLSVTAYFWWTEI